MMVGFPYLWTYTQKTSLRYPTANFQRMTYEGSFFDGSLGTTNQLSHKGGFGSGIFIMHRDEQGKAKLYLMGIHESEGGIGLLVAGIVERLNINNPKVLAEVTKVIEDGICK